jgi:hypothetical protein
MPWPPHPELISGIRIIAAITNAFFMFFLIEGKTVQVTSMV